MNNEIEEIKEQEKNEDKIIEKNIVNDHRFISPIVISNFIDEEETNIQYYTSTFILRNNSLICKNSSTNLKKKENGNKESICLYCKATSTPMWRKGPDGYKSLCNACGLKYYRIIRKERNLIPTSTPNSIHMILN